MSPPSTATTTGLRLLTYTVLLNRYLYYFRWRLHVYPKASRTPQRNGFHTRLKRRNVMSNVKSAKKWRDAGRPPFAMTSAIINPECSRKTTPFKNLKFQHHMYKAQCRQPVSNRHTWSSRSFFDSLTQSNQPSTEHA